MHLIKKLNTYGNTRYSQHVAQGASKTTDISRDVTFKLSEYNNKMFY